MNSHLSIEQSRRDDLESLGYILVYFMKGKLPWQGLLFFDEDTRMRRIAELKCSITPDKLTEGLSKEFLLYFKHVKNLKFTEKPDYEYLKGLFALLAGNEGINLESQHFEWETSKPDTPRKRDTNSLGPQNLKKEKNKTDVNLDQNVLNLPKKKMDRLGERKLSSQGIIKQQHSTTQSNFLQIPLSNSNNNLPTSSNEEDIRKTSMQFSHMVKVDSGSQIISKEDFAFDYEKPHIGDNMHSSLNELTNANQRQKKDYNSQVKALIEVQSELEDEQISENYSRNIMDENAASIQEKIDMKKLTPR